MYIYTIYTITRISSAIYYIASEMKSTVKHHIHSEEVNSTN